MGRTEHRGVPRPASGDEALPPRRRAVPVPGSAVPGIRDCSPGTEGIRASGRRKQERQRMLAGGLPDEGTESDAHGTAIYTLAYVVDGCPFAQEVHKVDGSYITTNPFGLPLGRVEARLPRPSSRTSVSMNRYGILFYLASNRRDPYIGLMTMLKFRFDEEKALETLCLVAERWPGVTPFYLSKTLYLAEREHLNRYGRPIFGDTYIAMQNGPVPSATYDVFKGDLLFAGDPAAFTKALEVRRSDGPPQLFARRPADVDALSDTDIECIDGAIGRCKGRSFKSLSQETHEHRAWYETPADTAIDYALMFDEGNPSAEALLDEAREYAAYGVS